MGYPGAMEKKATSPLEGVFLLPITLDEFRRELRLAVAEALDAQTPAPELVDRPGLAKALSCSATHVDRMRSHPDFPTLYFGDSPRFKMAEVEAWMRAHGPLRAECAVCRVLKKPAGK